MNYTVYNELNGAILRNIFCPAVAIQKQIRVGERYIEGEYLSELFYIEKNAPILKPEKPSEFHVFDYTTKQWVDPRTPETEWPLVRIRRNELLQQSDWTQLPDVPLATKEAWAEYRQALRDITDQPDPFNIVWPTPPT